MLAAEDLKRFQNMPTPHKWTWGKALTAEDVLSLHHISRQCEHTGYETTLKPGVLPRVFSATNTPPPSNAKFGSLPDPQSPPPPTPHHYPSNLGSLYRINESSDGALNPGSTWLDFEDSPLSNGADGSRSGDVAGKEVVDDTQVDGESEHTGTRMSNAIYVSDSKESEVPAPGTAPNADIAADLWLEEVEMGEEDTNDEYDESGGTPESDPIAAFKLAPAQVVVEDLWFSPGMNHTDLMSDEEVDDSDEEEDSDEENSDEDSGEVSDGAAPPSPTIADIKTMPLRKLQRTSGWKWKMLRKLMMAPTNHLMVPLPRTLTMPDSLVLISQGRGWMMTMWIWVPTLLVMTLIRQALGWMMMMQQKK